MYNFLSLVSYLVIWSLRFGSVKRMLKSESRPRLLVPNEQPEEVKYLSGGATDFSLLSLS